MYLSRAKEAEREARTLYDTVNSAPKQRIILFASSSEGTRAAPERRLTFDPKTMQKIKVSARLLINDKEVGHTDEQVLNPDFTIDFNWSFSVQLYRWPEKARLQVYERQSILQTKHLISEIKLGIPMGDEGHFEDLHPLSYNFAATVPFSPNWATMGGETMYMGGDIFVHCRWANKMDLLLGLGGFGGGRASGRLGQSPGTKDCPQTSAVHDRDHVQVSGVQAHYQEEQGPAQGVAEDQQDRPERPKEL